MSAKVCQKVFVFFTYSSKISRKNYKGIDIFRGRITGLHNFDKRLHNRKVCVPFFQSHGISGRQRKYTYWCNIKNVSLFTQDATGEKLSTFYLFQSISIAIQKGNAACVQGCVKDKSPGLEGLFNFQVHKSEELNDKKNNIIYT